METAAYLAFKADIDSRGLQQPLEITEAGVVLDGHARLQAAMELGIEKVEVIVVAPADEVEYMLLARCNAGISAHHSEPHSQSSSPLPAASAKTATKRRRANLTNRRRGGNVATSAARPRDRRRTGRRLARAPSRTPPPSHAHDPDLFAADQKRPGRRRHRRPRSVRRRLRDATLPQPPPLPNGPFDLIYADPPWQLRRPRRPLRARKPLPDDAARRRSKRCRSPRPTTRSSSSGRSTALLPEALEVIDAWGFSYLTNLAWVKPSIGLGRWTRNRHELLLLARRGNHPGPRPARPTGLGDRGRTRPPLRETRLRLPAARTGVSRGRASSSYSRAAARGPAGAAGETKRSPTDEPPRRP